MSWYAVELREYIKRTRAYGERLDARDYFGKQWLGDYAGMVDVLGDCLEELLNQGVQRLDPFATETAARIVKSGHVPMGGC